MFPDELSINRNEWKTWMAGLWRILASTNYINSHYRYPDRQDPANAKVTCQMWKINKLIKTNTTNFECVLQSVWFLFGLAYWIAKRLSLAISQKAFLFYHVRFSIIVSRMVVWVLGCAKQICSAKRSVMDLKHLLIINHHQRANVARFKQGNTEWNI